MSNRTLGAVPRSVCVLPAADYTPCTLEHLFWSEHFSLLHFCFGRNNVCAQEFSANQIAAAIIHHLSTAALYVCVCVCECLCVCVCVDGRSKAALEAGLVCRACRRGLENNSRLGHTIARASKVRAIQGTSGRAGSRDRRRECRAGQVTLACPQIKCVSPNCYKHGRLTSKHFMSPP